MSGFIDFTMRTLSLVACVDRCLEHLVGSVPQTSDRVHLFPALLVSELTTFLASTSDSMLSVMSLMCAIVPSESPGNEGSLQLLCSPLPSMNMTLQDHSFLLSASTTTYMDSPSKLIKQHSLALSSSLVLCSSGTLIKHLVPNMCRCAIKGACPKTLSYGVMPPGRMLEGHLLCR